MRVHGNAKKPLPKRCLTKTSAIIEMLGGPSKLSKRLKLRDHTVVVKWRKNGVSPYYVCDVAKLAGVKPQELRPDIFKY